MILCFVILLLLACSVIFTLFCSTFSSNYREQANSHMFDIVEQSGAGVTNQMNQMNQLSVTIITNQAVQGNLLKVDKKSHTEKDAAEYRVNIAKEIRGNVFSIPGIVSVRIYSLSGEEAFIGMTNREYLEYSQTEEDIYKANGAALWGIDGSAKYVCMCRAILNTSNMMPLGYMVIVADNSYFSDELATESEKSIGHLYLIDRSGKVITKSDKNGSVSEFPLSENEVKEENEKYIIDPLTKDESYYFGKKLDNGWMIVGTVSTKKYAEDIRKIIFQLSIIMFFSMGFIVFISTIAVRKLLGPTEKLLSSMSEFGHGKMDSRVQIYGKDEISQIGRAYNQMADNVQHLMDKVYSLELANKEAEIEFLKMQINPHFLYNSLDTISWMGFTSNNEKISDLAVSLASLLRASIQRENIITVDEELQIAQNYLKIQSYRFGDKIEVKYVIDDAARCCCIPGFILQPIIENSIIHGLEDMLSKGTLCIMIQKRDDMLYFEIADNGLGMSDDQLKDLIRQCKDKNDRQGIGLKNVYRRLQLMYGERSRLTIRSEKGKGTIISFFIPVQKNMEEAKSGKETEL